MPLTFEALYGEEAKLALDDGDTSVLQDLDALISSLLESTATDLTQQLTAYYIIASSVHRHPAATAPPTANWARAPPKCFKTWAPSTPTSATNSTADA